MKLFQPDSRKRRTLGAVFAITLTVTTLLTAFFQTQVLSGEAYKTRAEENRLRPVTIPAPRGTIIDRNGDIVATSVASYSVNLLPGAPEVMRQTLIDIAPFLGLSNVQVAKLIEKKAARPNDLLTITEDATYAQVAAIEERRSAFPNIMTVERPKRYYPAGRGIGHIIGYVAEVDSAELKSKRYREAGYKQGRWVGKTGIEKEYEIQLGGEEGAYYVEVDAMGRIIDPRRRAGLMQPIPGDTVRLTLDIELQNYIAQIFPDTMKGAVVAMIPSTGEVLAMYSNPTFDANDFVGGPKLGLWRALATDAEKPLLNRMSGSLYPPASTWKLATAAAGLEKGLVKADTRMPISCNGGMFYAGRYSRCWYSRGHGPLDLVGAIQNSCNVYFYQLGIQLGLQNLIDAGVRYGFASKSGIDLPGEKAGEFPTGLAWYEKRFGHKPYPSEVMSLSIGQGPNAQTVLRIAHFYSAIAGNGTAPEPHLVTHPGAGQGVGAIKINLGAEGLQALWAGLAKVTEQGGTAWLSGLERWKLYGKTGTAQNPHGDDHGWFAGFAGPPGARPQIAVVAFVEHGLHGSDVAPLAAMTANFYLNKKYGLPFDRKPILRDRWWERRCPWNQTCVVSDSASAVSPVVPQFSPNGQHINPVGPARGRVSAR